jgi:hypothetical protein
MGRRLTQAQQKAKLLAVLAKTDNVSEACQAAKITKDVYRTLVASGSITPIELQDAKDSYTDRVLSRMNNVGLDGIDKPVVRYNKVQTNADGTPLMEKQYDLTALRMLGERIVRMQQEQHEQVTDDSIPALYRIVIDARLLTSSEFATVKRIAQAIDDRRANALISQLSPAVFEDRQ